MKIYEADDGYLLSVCKEELHIIHCGLFDEYDATMNALIFNAQKGCPHPMPENVQKHLEWYSDTLHYLCKTIKRYSDEITEDKFKELGCSGCNYILPEGYQQRPVDNVDNATQRKGERKCSQT